MRRKKILQFFTPEMSNFSSTSGPNFCIFSFVWITKGGPLVIVKCPAKKGSNFSGGCVVTPSFEILSEEAFVDNFSA